MLYRITLPTNSGYTARSHWGAGTFLAGEPREVDLSPEYAESLRMKGYKVEPVEAREQTPTRPAGWRKHQVLPDKDEED